MSRPAPLITANTARTLRFSVSSGSWAFIKYRVKRGNRTPKSDCERCALSGMRNIFGVTLSSDSAMGANEVMELDALESCSDIESLLGVEVRLEMGDCESTSDAVLPASSVLRSGASAALLGGEGTATSPADVLAAAADDDDRESNDFMTSTGFADRAAFIRFNRSVYL